MRAVVQGGVGEFINILLLILLKKGYVRFASIAQVFAFWFFLRCLPSLGMAYRVKPIFWDTRLSS